MIRSARGIINRPLTATTPWLILFVLLPAAILSLAAMSPRIEYRYGLPTVAEQEYAWGVRGHIGHSVSWSAWHLNRRHLDGDATREGISFLADETVPGEFRATPRDYEGAGDDRGHLCPAADCSWSERAMRECHLLSNIMPQTKELNERKAAWEGLEEHTRDLAGNSAGVWIVAGPAFLPDEAGKIEIDTIGRHSVWVPTHCFKTLLIEGRDGEVRLEAYLMPNTHEPPMWQECAVSVDELEAATGFDFWSALPDKKEDELEAGQPQQTGKHAGKSAMVEASR